MMAHWIWGAPRFRIALAALAGGVGLLGLTWWRALRSDELAASTFEQRAKTDPQDAPSPVTGYSLERVLGAVSKDPFHPERRRPGAKFQLPADLAATAVHHQETQATEQSVRVIGTAVAPDGGGFAMCAWAGGSPRIVRLGEHVGAWVLSRVSPGAVEFTTSAGRAVVVRVPKAGT